MGFRINNTSGKLKHISNIFENKNTSSGPYSEMFCSIVGFTRDFGGPDYSPVLSAVCGMILVLGYSIHVKLFIFQV